MTDCIAKIQKDRVICVRDQSYIDFTLFSRYWLDVRCNKYRSVQFGQPTEFFEALLFSRPCSKSHCFADHKTRLVLRLELFDIRSGLNNLIKNRPSDLDFQE